MREILRVRAFAPFGLGVYRCGVVSIRQCWSLGPRSKNRWQAASKVCAYKRIPDTEIKKRRGEKRREKVCGGYKWCTLVDGDG